MKPSRSDRHRPYRLLEATGVAPAFFRQLTAVCDVGVGSRVLLRDFDEGAMAEYLACLGVDVVDEFPVGPGDEFRAESSIPLTSARRLDVVLSPWTRSRFDERDLHRTARLLADLRPRGHLVFLSLTHDEAAMESCRRHLAIFPGACDVYEHHPGLLRSLAARMTGLATPGGFQMLTFRTPENAIPRRQWLAIAEGVCAAQEVRSCDSEVIERPSVERREAA